MDGFNTRKALSALWKPTKINSIICFEKNKIFGYSEIIDSWYVPSDAKNFQYEWIIENKRMMVEYDYDVYHYRIDYDVTLNGFEEII